MFRGKKQGQDKILKVKGRRIKREQALHLLVIVLHLKTVTYGPTDNLHGLFLLYCIQFPWFLQMIKQVILDNSDECLKVQIYTSFSKLYVQ